MNPALRRCQRFRKLSFNLRPARSHQYSVAFQPRNLRPGLLSTVYCQTHPNSRISLRKASTMASEPQFAEGINAEQLRPLLNELQGEGWGLDEDKIGIKKTFYFRSYFKAVVGSSFEISSFPGKG